MKPTARCAQGLRLTKRSFSRDDRLARDGARMHTGSNSRSLMVSSPPPPVSPIVIVSCCPRLGDKFEAPLERDEAEFGPSGVAATPLSGSGSAGGGGIRNADDGAGRSSQSQRGKNRREHGKRGGRTYARTRPTLSGRRTWRKSRRLSCRGADGGRGWINASHP